MCNLALVLACAAWGSHAHQAPAALFSGTTDIDPLHSLVELLRRGDVAAAFNAGGSFPPAGSRPPILHRSSRGRSPSLHLSAAAPRPLISRRDAAKALLLLPTLTLWPQRSAAARKDDPDRQERKKVEKMLTDVREEQKQWIDFTTKLQKGKIRGDQAADTQIVMRTLTIRFGTSEKILNDTILAMTKLDPPEMERLRELTTSVAESILKIKKGARRQAAQDQITGAEEVGKAFQEFVALASTKYEIPAMPDDPPEFDMKTYLGVLSCEARGLVRAEGSNSCIRPDTPDGKPPRPDPNRKRKIKLLPDM